MKKPMLVLLTLTLLAALVSASAQMPPGGMPGHGDDDTGDMPGHGGMGDGGMGGPHSPHYGDRGFETSSEFMIIEGLIDLDESGIILSISATPNITAMEEMADEHMGDRSMMDDMMGDDVPTNSINVTLYKLVEFEDTGIPGFDENDTVVSSYELNSNTLGDLVYTTDGVAQNYSVSSDDGVFSMVVEAQNGDVQSFKWSVEIAYPFVSNTSDLAMLHDVVAENNMGMDRDHMMGGMGGGHGEMTPPTQYQNNSMIMENADIPMFFKWLDVAEVDGQNETVEATSSVGYFALSIPQGQEIYYDPSIGVENSAIIQIDNDIQEIFLEASNSFMDAVLSPTTGAIALAAVLLTVVLIVINRRSLSKK